MVEICQVQRQVSFRSSTSSLVPTGELAVVEFQQNTVMAVRVLILG